MPEYKYSVLVGLLVCIGGVSESLVSILYKNNKILHLIDEPHFLIQVKEACHHFTEHMKSVTDDEFEKLCSDIIAVWEGKVLEVEADERIHQCILMSIERLATAGAFKDQFERSESEFAANILTFIKKEAISSKGSTKLISCVELLCHLVQVDSIIYFFIHFNKKMFFSGSWICWCTLNDSTINILSTSFCLVT
jgi:hypothetical protein